MAATTVTVAIAVFNLVWTVWAQRRDRESRRVERQEDREARGRERAAEQQRWVEQGHIVSVKVIHSHDSDGTLWAHMEVRNTGRGSCTVAEVGYWYAPSGPTYIYYSSEPDTGFELERHSAPLPYVLQGGRKAEWFMPAEQIRSTVSDSEHGSRLQLLVELETGERYTVPFPQGPLPPH